MNRFLTKRGKAKDDDGSAPPLPSGAKKGKKGKKGQIEQKPELDLTAVLPSTDEFRTSLIMPNLSARFSMLREQDDPKSKLGKASDDSVILKRASRYGEFGFTSTGLSDIVEVSSINGSIRPPFAQDRSGSVDGYNTDDDSSQSGSVMSRARPGEGNVLFGGRQKIYKIPASANKGAKGLGGKPLYDDDVSLSAFQKYRMEERERKSQDNEEEQSSPTKDGSDSPALSGYSRKRETASSTTSGPSITRSSTAATSVASQGTSSIPASSPTVPTSTQQPSSTSGVERSTTKARRLYEQGLDQHMSEQQNSAVSRLNSIQRQRLFGANTPPYLQHTKSTSNLHDRFNRSGTPVGTSSPPPSAGLGRKNTFGAVKEAGSLHSSPRLGYQQSPPMSPLGSDDEANPLTSALNANDRGKATAMGAFNKPKQFDEQQYLQRTRQMHRGRETPELRRDPPSRPPQQPLPSMERDRVDPRPTDRSTPAPRGQKAVPSAFSVFQNAANQMTTLRSPAPDSHNHYESPGRQRGPESRGTFFASPDDDSDSEMEQSKITQPIRPSELDRRIQAAQRAATPVAPPPMRDHPALRSLNQRQAEVKPEETRPWLQPGNSRASAAESTGTAVKSDATDVDSPTLGPDNGGLSGLVRQHLRNGSTVSSVYDDPPHDRTPVIDTSRDISRRNPGARSSETDTAVHSSYSHSNPWDLEDLENSYYGDADNFDSHSPVDKLRNNQGGLQQANGDLRRQTFMRDQEMNSTAPWEQELRKSHTRMPSTETQHEREAFANELAARQKAIQESLRLKTEQSNRSASPGPAMSNTLKAWGGMLRTKSSRDSMAGPNKTQEPSTKAMKMLGLGMPPTNASTTSLAQPSDRFYKNDLWKSEDSRIGQERDGSRQSRFPRYQEPEHPSIGRPSEEVPRGQKKPPSPPESSKSSLRNRSSSEVSSRSRSRAGRYRDDLEKAMVEGTGSSASVIPEFTPAITKPYSESAQGSPQASQQPSLPHPANRLRSNSRSTAASYFDQKSLHPIYTSHSPLVGSTPNLSSASTTGLSPGLPPHPSPGAHSPAFASGRPSPVSPYSASATPPMSATVPTVSTNFSAIHATQAAKSLGNRKKSISKATISEPVLISSTSVVDTVDLPPGASLRNGMDEVPPPVPPINPLRRRFGFGRSETHDVSKDSPSMAGPAMAHANTFVADNEKQVPQRNRLRKTSSEGRSLHGRARQETITGLSPLPPGVQGSPPRPIIVEGAMF